ncbi:4478_t:CDS:2 [Entrophospora sp. SA101]|nr:4476_t:CDS:2 [Entrophospora sp. SA101]CAJ0760546.1 4478_t:CDS:2 [Entrophospora sp. SA101]
MKIQKIKIKNSFFLKSLYIYGGRTAIPGENYDSLNPDYDTDEILYLDISVEFNPASPKWKSITGIAPPLAFHSMSIGGESNELLIIFGGTSKYTIPPNTLYIFNTTSSTKATNSPTTVNVKGSIEHTSITRYNDSMVFIFGGTSQIITNDNATDIVIDAFNDMHVLDSKSITFNTISPSNGNATGAIPIDRRVHRAVGTNDNKIIIYGGCNKDYSINYSDLIVLDTTTLQWTAPATQGTPPPPMYAHTMTMVGTNVIIAFGFISGFDTTQDIYILDSTNYTWMPTYVPNNLEITNTKPINASSNDPSSSPSSPSQLNYSNNNSDYYSEKPQPPTPPSKYDDDDGYPQSNRLSASSSLYAPSRPDSPPSMNPPILPSSTDTSSFSSSNENNDEIVRVTDNDYDNDNAAPIFSISPSEEAGIKEPRKIEKRAFSLRSAQRLSSTVVRPNRGTPSTTEETITEEFTQENL